MNFKPDFKCWEPINNKMYYPAFPTWNGDVEVWKDNKPQTETILLPPYADEEPILLMNTGLRDKFNEEVFVGDIVELWHEGFKQSICRGIVEYKHDKAIFIVRINGKDYADFYCGDYILKLGNKYENPELLEG